MAKSKSGGTRAMIRGRVGNDVYSIGLNGAGKKQQVVRSLAEVVANPQTTAQMKGRIIMSTIMQAVAGLRPIIDHSFDNVPNGQPSISEFISRNYKLIKDDIAANPATNAEFALNEYQEKGIQMGKYVVSAGGAILPAAVAKRYAGLKITLANSALTVGGLKAAIDWADGDYLTMVAIAEDQNEVTSVMIFRARLSTTLADDTAITSANVGSLFTFEGTFNPTVRLEANDDTTDIFIGDDTVAAYDSGVIISKNTENGYKHSDCQLSGVLSTDRCYDDVKDTYPNGSATFLNGGNLQ